MEQEVRPCLFYEGYERKPAPWEWIDDIDIENEQVRKDYLYDEFMNNEDGFIPTARASVHILRKIGKGELLVPSNELVLE